jgi:hypothetical protein
MRCEANATNYTHLKSSDGIVERHSVDDSIAAYNNKPNISCDIEEEEEETT